MRLVHFVSKMALAFVLSAIFIAVVSLLGLIFTAFSIYLLYIHWKFSHIPGPKRDSFFFGNVPLIRRKREKGKIMGEWMQELHSIYGPVAVSYTHLTLPTIYSV